jgi:hypothetical protein
LYIAAQREQWLCRLQAAYAERNTDQDLQESWEDEDRELWPEFEGWLRAAWPGIK